VIAVLLGWLILHEPVTGRTFLAMALIVAAVVWIQLSHKLADGRTGGQADGQAMGGPAREPGATPVSPAASPPVRQTAC
jgi:hypothetical protein